jgi:hypothetical protein
LVLFVVSNSILCKYCIAAALFMQEFIVTYCSMGNRNCFRSFRHLPMKNIYFVLCCMVTGFGLKFQCVNTYVTSLTRWKGRVRGWGWLCPHQCVTWMVLLRKLSVQRRMMRGSAGVWIRLELRFQTHGKYFPQNMCPMFCHIIGFSTFSELKHRKAKSQTQDSWRLEALFPVTLIGLWVHLWVPNWRVLSSNPGETDVWTFMFTDWNLHLCYR